MWPDTTHADHARAGPALPSDLTDAEWAVLEPFFPPPSHVGRPRKWPLRRIVEAILYLLRGGLPWRMLPPCFAPASSVRRWFYLWCDNRLWQTLNHDLPPPHGSSSPPSRSSPDAAQDLEIKQDNFESDGVVAALPRRHRNVPR